MAAKKKKKKGGGGPITRREFATAVKSLQEQKEQKIASEQMSFDNFVFLSHSHYEKKLVEDARNLFKTYNVGIYVDWIDKRMPKITQKETANRIKEMIGKSKKFILLASYSTLKSKWCNWELGFADAQKRIDNVAILAIANNDKTWIGNEYLTLYPEIYQQEANWKVRFSDKEDVFLDKWLSAE